MFDLLTICPALEERKTPSCFCKFVYCLKIFGAKFKPKNAYDIFKFHKNTKQILTTKRYYSLDVKIKLMYFSNFCIKIIIKKLFYCKFCLNLAVKEYNYDVWSLCELKCI